MREILFRGKRLDNGEWAYGALIHIGDFCAILEHDQDKFHSWDQTYMDSDNGCIDGYATTVNPDTVGQFTGLLDKNGKKIFEGDIVSGIDCLYPDNNEIYGKVVYGPHSIFNLGAGFYIADGDYVYCRWLDYEIEIIGNAHDNPELVGEKDETC